MHTYIYGKWNVHISWVFNSKLFHCLSVVLTGLQAFFTDLPKQKSCFPKCPLWSTAPPHPTRWKSGLAVAGWRWTQSPWWTCSPPLSFCFDDCSLPKPGRECENKKVSCRSLNGMRMITYYWTVLSSQYTINQQVAAYSQRYRTSQCCPFGTSLWHRWGYGSRVTLRQWQSPWPSWLHHEHRAPLWRPLPCLKRQVISGISLAGHSLTLPLPSNEKEATWPCRCPKRSLSWSRSAGEDLSQSLAGRWCCRTGLGWRDESPSRRRTRCRPAGHTWFHIPC